MAATDTFKASGAIFLLPPHAVTDKATATAMPLNLYLFAFNMFFLIIKMSLLLSSSQNITDVKNHDDL
ncbi:hypothetical protein [Rheinheimera sp. NSM]|uniref:hypothetical protein n=1 Tax=Rheinheimera sp. NSM TaxID=3457884 RepID=UPI0040368EA9